MFITMTQSCLLSQHSLLYTKTKFPIISNCVKPFKLQSPSSFNNNSSTFSHSLPLTTITRTTRRSSFLTFAVDKDGNFEDPNKSLNIFVSNLPGGLKLGKLFMLFEEVGTVNAASLNAGDVGGQSFASVTMSTVEEVEQAINKFNGYELNGKLLTLSREKPIKEQPKPQQRPRAYDSDFGIRIQNLPRDVDNGRLEELLSKYGKVESVEIVYNEQLDESTGYAIMANETDMNNAIHYLFAWRWKDKEPGLLVYPVNLQVKDPSSNW